MTVTVHHLKISQSERAVWAAEELGLDYKLKLYNRLPSRQAPPDYESLSPTGTAPVIEDDGVIISESGAVVEYLNALHGQSRLSVGPHEPFYADYLFWLHASNASLMMIGIVQMVVADIPNGDQSNEYHLFSRRVSRYLSLLEAHLAGKEYICGSKFTLADLMMFFPLATMRLLVPLDIDTYPNIKSYVKRMAHRPAYRQAMTKCDPEVLAQVDDLVNY